MPEDREVQDDELFILFDRQPRELDGIRQLFEVREKWWKSYDILGIKLCRATSIRVQRLRKRDSFGGLNSRPEFGDSQGKGKCKPD
jgi:hypothetical protein